MKINRNALYIETPDKDSTYSIAHVRISIKPSFIQRFIILFTGWIFINQSHCFKNKNITFQNHTSFGWGDINIQLRDFLGIKGQSATFLMCVMAAIGCFIAFIFAAIEGRNKIACFAAGLCFANLWALRAN